MSDLMYSMDLSQVQTSKNPHQMAKKLSNVPGLSKEGFQAKAREKAEDFEAMFISQMLKPMMESVDTDGYFSGGQTEGVFRSMMVDEIGKSISSQGGIGLADSIYNELLKMQEA